MSLSSLGAQEREGEIEEGERSTSSAVGQAISVVAPHSWTTQAVLSSYVGDGHVEGYMDLLIPLLQNDNGMLFLYPRFGMSSDVDSGYSMGLGFRHYLPAIDAILGANVFYDRYASSNDNYYNQISLGLEVLTRWVDARFNYYIPDSSPNMIDSQNVRSRSQTQTSTSSWGEAFATGYTIRQPLTTTTRTTTTTVNQLFERFEDTMQGYDAEVGVLTPWLERYVALRWFAGYYSFNNSYGDDLSGFKGRAELRFSSKLAVDATYYQDEEITGGNWLFGIRMSIPIFMENLSDGRSPFAGSFSGMFDGVNLSGKKRGQEALKGASSGYAPMSPFAAMAPAPSFAAASSRSSGVRDRMTEVVLRLPGARTTESDFIENLAARDVDVDVDIDRSTRIVVIEDSIVFVNNASGAVAAPGTFENPLDTIQGGVNRASTLFGNRGDVMVAGTGTNYTEDVVDAASSVRIWGGGRGFPVNGGRRFTYGSQPVLDGGFGINNIPLFSLSGFSIENGFFAGNGLLIDSVNDLTIMDNDISAVLSAVQITYPAFTEEAEVNITNNVFRDSDTGLDIIIDAEAGSSIETLVLGNQFTNNINDGFSLFIDNDNANVMTSIIGNRASGNGIGGIDMDVIATAGAVTNTLVVGNRMMGNSSFGMDFDITAFAGTLTSSLIENNLFSNTVVGIAGLRMSAVANTGAVVETEISGNQFLDNIIAGLFVQINSVAADTSTFIRDNTALRNGVEGILLNGVVANDSSFTAEVTGNQTNDNAYGIGFSIQSDASWTSSNIMNNTALRNDNAGFVVTADVALAPLSLAPSRLRFINNIAESNATTGLIFEARVENTGSAFFFADVLGNQFINNDRGMEFSLDVIGDPLVPGSDTPSAVTIFGNNFSNNTTEGAIIDVNYLDVGFSGLNVIGNSFSNNGGNAGLQLELDVEASTLFVDILGNQFSNNLAGNGLNLENSSREDSTIITTIADNSAMGNGRNGLRLVIDTQTMSRNNIRIRDNQLNSNGFDGLFVDLVSFSSENSLVVEDNTFFGNTDDGFDLVINSSNSSLVNTSIERNQIQDNGDDGIFGIATINSGSSALFQINDNAILGNGDDGFDFYVRANNDSIYWATITDNELGNNAGNGVLLAVESDFGSSAISIFNSNTMWGNGLNGVDIQAVAENAVGLGTVSGIDFSSNIVENNALDGLTMDLVVDELGGGNYMVSIVENEFLNNGNRGMSLFSDLTASPLVGNGTIVQMDILNNAFNGNGSSGVLMLGTVTNITALSEMNVSGNQFLNNGAGLTLSVDADNSFLPIEIGGNIIENSVSSSIALGVTGAGTVDFSSTLDNITSGTGIGLSLFDLGTPAATGDIMLNGVVINFPDPGDIAE
ncbi:MAG: hypothetical protein L3J39_08705 [Verrucomicrobiales bacterium]|nr:hypothetical protein [Verrucomicrobiales bacterium]